MKRSATPALPNRKGHQETQFVEAHGCRLVQIIVYFRILYGLLHEGQKIIGKGQQTDRCCFAIKVIHLDADPVSRRCRFGQEKNQLFDWLAWSPLHYLEKISYGVYVYHLFLQPLALKIPGMAWLAWLSFVVLVAASIGLAHVSWVIFERPILRLKQYSPLALRSARAYGSSESSGHVYKSASPHSDKHALVNKSQCQH